jgi:peptide/nickel transport system ATP-binding protein/peptide/nickel transport system permease protein
VIVMYRGEIVEAIKATDLTVERAQHPYTKSLLAATPDITAPLPARLAAVSEATLGGQNA